MTDTQKKINEKVKEFLENPASKGVEFELASPDHLMKAVEAAGGETDPESMDTNGWQYDWWINGEYEGRELTLGGTAYYGTGGIAWKK